MYKTTSDFEFGYLNLFVISYLGFLGINAFNHNWTKRFTELG